MENWSEWFPFPDPRILGYITAPLGPGVYELRRSDTKEGIIRGSSKNCAFRISSLLPPPFEAGTRKNKDKQNYTLEHIKNIEYRCCACLTEEDAKAMETELHREEPFLFKT